MALPRRDGILLALLLGLILAVAAGAETLRVRLDEGTVAALTDDSELFVEAYPQRGEGLLAFTRRLTGDAGAAERISELNSRPRRLLAGVRYKVPYELLRPENQLAVVRALFPADRTRREKVTRDTPLGELEGWLYTVENADAGTVSEFFFAEKLPGAPVHMRVTRDGEVLTEMTQIERHRP